MTQTKCGSVVLLRSFCVFSAVLALSGCAAQNQQMSKYAVCKQYNNFIEHMNCTHKTAEADTVLYPNNPEMQTLIAYGDVLVEKLKAHKITNAEANYAYDDKRSQLAAQESQTRSARISASAASEAAWAANRPHTTNCTGFGNSISCTGY